MIMTFQSKAPAILLAVIGAVLGGTLASSLVGMAFLAAIFT